MLIRPSTENDINKIAELYKTARLFMINHGNPNQWTPDYPNDKTAKDDILSQSSYIIEDKGTIVGTFYFHIGAEIDYNNIYQGEWLNDKPYGVVHRLASNGDVKGISKPVFDWCFEQIDNIRLDTHFDNHVMQQALTKYGFKNVGIVHIIELDYEPYLAYQMEKPSNN